MFNYVLVHGGWHGGWCWQQVAGLLRQQGHAVYCPTLTGLAERAHLIDCVQGPDTHVDDIANLIIWEDLSDVILVGHSYAGLVITGVATRIAQRIRHLVYLDAFVPTASHQAASDLSIASRAKEIAEAAAGHDHIPPTGFERWAASPEKRAWLKQMTTPHPRACFGKGVSEISDPSDANFSRTYILCGQHEPSPFRQFYERYSEDDRWQCEMLDCLHDAMVDARRAGRHAHQSDRHVRPA